MFQRPRESSARCFPFRSGPQPARHRAHAAASADRPDCCSPTAIDWDRPQTAHLIGAAGAGMRALARVLLERGWRLTGSDCRAEPEAPFPLFVGHARSHLSRDCRLVIYSDAIESSNPELQVAQQRGLPRLRYIEAVSGLLQSASRPRVAAVAGTHGKSTVSAMLGIILHEADWQPTVLCGGTPCGSCWGGGGRWGSGPWAVVESCEWNRNFLHFRPHAAVVLNIDHDHFDTYPDESSLHNAFAQFIGQTMSEGLVLLGCQAATIEPVSNVARMQQRRVIRFGWARDDNRRASQSTNDPEWTVRRLSVETMRQRLIVAYRGREVAHFVLPLPGRHNALNALAAFAASVELGVAPAKATQALQRFPGLCRRLEYRGCFDQIFFYDDYAHHPREISAALAAIRESHPGQRLVCVFQPHQRMRTERLFDQFAQSLSSADVLAVAEVFSARETYSADDRNWAERLRQAAQGPMLIEGTSLPELALKLAEALTPSDVFVTLGAGNICQLIDYLQRERISRCTF